MLRSTNTDVEGFLANLDSATPGWDRGLESAMVLGAGGGARAVIYALISREVQRIYVINRTRDRAEALQKKFGSRLSRGLGRNHRASGRRGFWSTPPRSAWSAAAPRDQSALPASMVVTDLVYVPLVTGLLAAARERGLRTADGLGMLLHQAVRGFELWFGIRPEVTPELRALVKDD